jgi:hypothetical protein
VYNTALPILDLEKLMYRTFPKFVPVAFAFVCFTTFGCSDDPPAAPTPQPNPGGTPALKANAPIPSSPGNGETLNTQRPTLQVEPAIASTSIAGGQNFAYDFEVQTESGSLVRMERNVGNTSWTYPEDLALDTNYRWRSRAVLENVPGPWSEFRAFRTLSLPGCRNGRLEDPKAYFFHVIGRKEGDPAGDWRDVMRRSGIPAGPVAGQRFPPNAPFYGLSQQISSGGELRGRLFLPTDQPSSFGYFIQDVDFLSDAAGSRWAWRPFGHPPYAPRACP